MAGRMDTTLRRGGSGRHHSSPRSPHNSVPASSSSPSPSPDENPFSPSSSSSQSHSFSRRLLVPMLRPNIRAFSVPSSPAFSPLRPPTNIPSPSFPSPGHAIRNRTLQARQRARSRSGSTAGDDNNVTYSPSPLSPASDISMSPGGIIHGSGKEQRKGHRNHCSQKTSSGTTSMAQAQARAQKENDSMVYLDGPQVYTCAQCRTHLTSHDDIISKSFHGRHGRAYLFDHCVNVTTGTPEDRLLITGLHSVCDIFCKRCKKMVGWTYSKAYEPSQKYKEGKYIIEKINLHLEESHFDVCHPAGERHDRWRKRSMSWGSGEHSADLIYEYRPRGGEERALSVSSSGSSNGVNPGMSGSPNIRKSARTANIATMPSPPFL